MASRTDMTRLHRKFVRRLEAAQADLLARKGWTFGYTRTWCTRDEQLPFWLAYQNPPHWPTAANPDATGYYVPGIGIIQHGSWHQIQDPIPDDAEDPDGSAHAADLQWPGANDAEHAAYALEAADIMAEHGLGFPVPGEYWHCQWFDWRGEYADQHEGPTPTAPAPVTTPEDLVIQIMRISGADALFEALTCKLPDGATCVVHMQWITDGNRVTDLTSHGVPTVDYTLDDVKRCALLGVTPSGDSQHSWSASDFGACV